MKISDSSFDLSFPDIIKKLNAAVDRLDKELSNQRMELDDSKEKVRSTQAALDASYK